MRTAANAIVLPAGVEHLRSIAELAGVIWRAYYPGIISHAQIQYMLGRMYDPRAMREELDRGIRYDRLMLGENLVGFASYGVASESGNSETKLHKLYVDTQFHRRGFGSLLLKHVEHSARALQTRALILSVNKTNTQAIAAYRKNGFAFRESVVVNIGGGFVMDDYVMAKPL